MEDRRFEHPEFRIEEYESSCLSESPGDPVYRKMWCVKSKVSDKVIRSKFTDISQAIGYIKRSLSSAGIRREAALNRSKIRAEIKRKENHIDLIRFHENENLRRLNKIKQEHGHD